MREFRMYGWRKERVLPQRSGSVVVRYRLATAMKVDRGKARTSLAKLRKVLEEKAGIESVCLTGLSGRLNYMGVGIWRVTLMVEFAGIEQENFFHLLKVE